MTAQIAQFALGDHRQLLAIKAILDLGRGQHSRPPHVLVAYCDQVQPCVCSNGRRNIAGIHGFHRIAERWREILNLSFAQIAGHDARRLGRHGLDVITSMYLGPHRVQFCCRRRRLLRRRRLG